MCFLKSPLLTIACLDPKYITAACEMVAEMVESLQSVLALGHKRNSGVPAFLTSVLRNIVVSLARLPLVNSYTRVPPLVSLVVPCRPSTVKRMGKRWAGHTGEGRTESPRPRGCQLWFWCRPWFWCQAAFLRHRVWRSPVEILGFLK